MLKKFGNEIPSKTDEVREKISKAMSSEKSQAKSRQTCLEKYGTEYVSQNKDVKNKINETFKLRGTFFKSIEEDLIFDILENNFPDVKRQYSSILYPHNCDFYIPMFDLYIEYNGSQYHNMHRYIPNKDFENLNALNEKFNSTNNSFFKDVVDTWTVKDIQKFKDAEDNKLNYLAIYPLFVYKHNKYVKIYKGNIEYAKDILLKTIYNFKNKTNLQIIIGES